MADVENMRWFESWDGVAFQTNWSSKRRGSWHQWPLDERLKYLKMTMARCWRTARWSGNGNKGPTFKLAIPFARPYKRSYIGLSQNGGCHHDTTNFEQFLGTLYWDPSVSSKMVDHALDPWIHHFLRHASAAENRVAWRCARVGPHCSTK